jgi:hypothetical protein
MAPVAAADVSLARGTPPAAPAREALAPELERVAKGLRGARARTGLSEADVVAILDRQGVSHTIAGLRRAESSGVIALALAACLADLYGTTTDCLAGRRYTTRRASLGELPAPRQV